MFEYEEKPQDQGQLTEPVRRARILDAASKEVERIAYEIAGDVPAALTSELILVAANLERLGKRVMTLGEAVDTRGSALDGL